MILPYYVCILPPNEGIIKLTFFPMIERHTLVKHNPDVRIRFDADTRQLFPQVRSMFEAIQIEIPSFCGEAIYGSRSKGSGTVASDIDGIFYFNSSTQRSDIIIPRFKKLLEELTPLYTGRDAKDLWWRDGTGFHDSVSMLFTPKPLLIEYILTDLERIKQHPDAHTFNDFRQTSDDADRYITIGGLFHFSIGRGIGNLRRSVFDTLRSYPDTPTSERYWGMIMHHLAHSDRSTDSFFREIAFSQYPQSIQEGTRYFHLMDR